MTSLHPLSLGSGHAAPAPAKSRGYMVRPMLKKLAHVEKKTSLDLDRPWEDQQQEQASVWSATCHGGTGGSPGSSFLYAGGLSGEEGATGAAGEGAMAGAAGFKFHHLRSHSASSSNGGGFVHPFQQTPRTSTPPLVSAISLLGTDREFSSTIAEDDDGNNADHHSPRLYHFPRYSANKINTLATASAQSHSQSQSQSQAPHHRLPSTTSQTSLRKPTTLAGQRTSSSSDLAIATSAPPQLRLNTSGRTGSPAPRTRSNLNLGFGAADAESGSSSIGASTTTTTTTTLGSPASSACSSAMSPLRSSLEAALPRLRSRSELDTAQRADLIRRERRRFEERERAKEERYDREMMRRRDRKDAREALSLEKEAAQRRKNSLGSVKGSPVVDAGIGIGSGAGGAVERTATPPPASARLSLSRRSTATATFLSTSAPLGRAGFHGLGGTTSRSANTSRNDVSSATLYSGNAATTTTTTTMGEKQPLNFLSRDYDSTVPGQDPLDPAAAAAASDVHFRSSRPHRPASAKKKTLGYWHGFVLWLRTKLLRMGSR